MTDYEGMSNDQLRLRLLECGYANTPVTQTTRNVLIKKLRNHLEGQKAKTKRETINVMQYSSNDEEEVVDTKKKTNRRATMAVPPKPPQSPSRMTRKSVERVEEKPAPAATRRSSRQTPQKIIIDDDDSEEEARTIPRNDRKKSESPSLSRSKTISTTYVNKKAVVNEVHEEEPEEDEDDNEEEEEEETVVELNKIPEFPKPRRVSPARPSFPATGLSRRTFGTTSSSTDLPPINTTYTSPKFSRPSLSTSYHPYTSPTRYNTTASTNAHNITDDINGTFAATDYDSPYLSSFTRRLSSLQAEPLSPQQIKPAIPKGTGLYYRTGKNSEVPLNKPDTTLSDHVWEVIHALGAYKKTFIFIIILVGLFVFFNYF